MPNADNIISADTFNKTRAAQDFLSWVGTHISPDAKETIISAVNSGGLGADNVGPNQPASEPWYSKIIDAAQKILPAYAQYKTQKEIVDLQIDRAKSGQPPLDVSQYTAPPITVQHQLGPVSQAISPQTKTMLWIGARLIGALILLPLLTSRR